MSKDTAWQSVAFIHDIPPETGTLQVVVNDEPVCLYLIDGQVCATQDKCPHGNANLSEGYLENGRIECPLHQGVFDVVTGKPLCPPVTTDIKTYAVRVEAGEILVRWE